MIASRPSLQALKQEQIDKAKEPAAKQTNRRQAQRKPLQTQSKKRVPTRSSTPLPWQKEPAQAKSAPLPAKSASHAKIPLKKVTESKAVTQEIVQRPLVRAKSRPAVKPVEPKQVAKSVPQKAEAAIQPKAKSLPPEPLKESPPSPPSPRQASHPVLTIPDTEQDEQQELIVSYRLAGGTKRFLALLLDGLALLVLLQAIASMELFGPSLPSLFVFFDLDKAGAAVRSGAMFKLFLSAITFGFVISLVLHLVPGRSLGEHLLGLQLIDRNTGSRPSTAGIVMRALASMLSGVFFGAGFFWIFVDREYRTWQDCLSQTTVIDFQPGATTTSPGPIPPKVPSS